MPYDLETAFKRSQALLRHVVNSGEWCSKQHLIHHTMGFIRLQQKQYASAANFLRLALSDLESRMNDRSTAPDQKGYAERKAEILFHLGKCGYRRQNNAEFRRASEMWRAAKTIVAKAWGTYARRACDGQYWMHHRIKKPDQTDATIAQIIGE